MAALFGFLLFWIGVVLVYAGTFIAPRTADTLEKALLLSVGSFFIGGILFMGTAVVNFSYSPPLVMQSPLVALVAWTALLAGLTTAFSKPSAIHGGQQP